MTSPNTREAPFRENALLASGRIAESRRRVALELVLGSATLRLNDESTDLKKRDTFILMFTSLFFPSSSDEKSFIRERGKQIEISLAEIVSIISASAHRADDEKVSERPTQELLAHLTIAERGRLAFLLEPLTHDTRIFDLLPAGAARSRVAFVSRYPGGANAITPVIDLLLKDPTHGAGISVITDDEARKIFEKKYPSALDVTPKGEFYAADHVATLGGADVLILDSASGDELSVFIAAEFLDSRGQRRPKIVTIHDSYLSSVKIYDRLTEWKLPLPDKICVMDDAQKKMIVKKYPHLLSRIEITGQPAFDVTPLQKKETRERVRNALGIKDSETLITIELRDDPGPGETEAIAEAVSKVPRKAEIVLAIRRHPRDTYKSYDEYAAMFEKRGVRIVHTLDAFPGGDGTAQIRLASDMMLGTAYTGGFAATYSHIPAIHVIDKKFGILNRPNAIFDIPTADLGAAVKLNHVEDVTNTITALMDPFSEQSQSLKRNMEFYYRPDGKNAERVALLVRSLVPDARKNA